MLSRVIMWRWLNAASHSYWPQMLIPSWEWTSHVAVRMTEISVKYLVVTGSALDMKSFFLWPKLSTPRMTKPALQVSSFFFFSFFLCDLHKEEVRSSWGRTGEVKWAGNLMWEAGLPGAVLILHYSKSHFYLQSTSSPSLLWVSHLKIHQMHSGITRRTWSSEQLEKMVLE